MIDLRAVGFGIRLAQAELITAMCVLIRCRWPPSLHRPASMPAIAGYRLRHGNPPTNMDEKVWAIRPTAVAQKTLTTSVVANQQRKILFSVTLVVFDGITCDNTWCITQSFCRHELELTRDLWAEANRNDPRVDRHSSCDRNDSCYTHHLGRWR